MEAKCGNEITAASICHGFSFSCSKIRVEGIIIEQNDNACSCLSYKMSIRPFRRSIHFHRLLFRVSCVGRRPSFSVFRFAYVESESRTTLANRIFGNYYVYRQFHFLLCPIVVLRNLLFCLKLRLAN